MLKRLVFFRALNARLPIYKFDSCQQSQSDESQSNGSRKFMIVYFCILCMSQIQRKGKSAPASIIAMSIKGTQLELHT